MEYLFFGLRFPPPRNFERVRVDNVDFNEKAIILKERLKNEVLKNDVVLSDEEICLIFCGDVLGDDEPINKYKVRAGSTIHVMKKPLEEKQKEYPKFTEVDVSRVTSYYRSLNSGNFYRISRPEVLQTIFKKHPELQKDVIAMSYLKCPVLLSNMQNPTTVRNMAEHGPRVLIEASETICKTLRNVKLSEPVVLPPIQSNIDEFSDSSSSSEGTSPTRPSTSSGGRITSDFLRRSLAAAQRNQNSLANISQRTLTQGGSNPLSPSTSSSAVNTPGRRNVISSSMFLNAMNEVLRARRSETEGLNPPANDEVEPMNTSFSAEEPPVAASEMPVDEPMEEDDDERDARDVEMITSFQTQLRQMEDMGLTNKATNIQALMVCNGNLEAAVNLVLAEMAEN